MNHAEVQRAMADYLEGDLPISRRALFDAHLDACEACHTEVTQMRDTIALLRRMPDPEPPSNFTADVMRRIRSGEAEATWLQRFGILLSERMLPNLAVPATAAAAGLAIAVVSGGVDLTIPGVGLGEGPPIPIASASQPVARPDRQTDRAAEESVASLVTMPTRTTPRGPTPGSGVLRDAGPRVARLEMRLSLPVSQPGPATAKALPRAASPQRIKVARSDATNDTASSVASSLAPGLSTTEQTPPVLVDVGRGPSGRLPMRGGRAISAGSSDGLSTASQDFSTGVPEEAASARQRQLEQLDPRIDELLSRPDAFVAEFRSKPEAQQELWLQKLSDRIAERGQQRAAVQALRGIGADSLSEAFAESLGVPTRGSLGGASAP